MILQKNPNSWSCLPTAFAMVLGIPVEEFIQRIGHDGAAEPYMNSKLKAGFHEQECIEVMSRSCACTPIEIIPSIIPEPIGFAPRPIFFGNGTELANWERLSNHMRYDGVLTGVLVAGGVGHAAAWSADDKKVLDPIGYSYNFEECKANDYAPTCFWKVQRI